MVWLFLFLAALCTGVAVLGALSAVNTRKASAVDRVTTFIEFRDSPSHISELGLDFGLEPRRSVLSSVITWLGGIFSGRLGAVGEDAIREQLMAAGMYNVSPRTVLGYRVLATIALPAFALLVLGVNSMLSILMIALALFVGWILPLTIVSRKARLRVTQIDRSLPDLIDLLCVMVEAGLSFTAALRLASEQFVSPLRDEIRLTLQEQTMGLGIDEAMAHMADRADTPAMRAFIRAMTQGERMGISTGQIMRNLSHEMRHRRRSSAEERAQKTPVLMLFPLVFLIFPAMFIILMTPAVISVMHSLKGF